MDRVCVSPMGSSLALSGERDEFVWETETETALKGHKSQNKREPLLQKWSGAAQEGRIIKIPTRCTMFVRSPGKSRVTLLITTARADITGVSQHLPPVCPQFVQSPVSPRSHPVIPVTISDPGSFFCVLLERMLSGWSGLMSGEISPIRLTVAALYSQCDLMGGENS